jgi:hypothetical protein
MIGLSEHAEFYTTSAIVNIKAAPFDGARHVGDPDRGPQSARCRAVCHDAPPYRDVRRRGAWPQALPLFQKPPKQSFTTRAATRAADKLRASLSEPQLIGAGKCSARR